MNPFSHSPRGGPPPWFAHACGLIAVGAVCALLSACETPTGASAGSPPGAAGAVTSTGAGTAGNRSAAAVPAAAPPAAAPPPIMPFDQAVLSAANGLFSNAKIEPRPTASRGVGENAKIPLVIDPLVDGNTGFQSVATETMESRITSLVQSKYPQFELQPFNTATLAKQPLLFVGTFTPVNMDGSNKPGRDWHRICLALIDLRTGTIVSKGFARAALEGVDMTPTALYLDSPAWAPDPTTNGYVKTCQGTKAGDQIKAEYWDRLIAAAMINDATLAYNKGNYEEALDIYRGVMRQPGGDQLRVYNGVYLAASKLGRKAEAVGAFARIVDFGLAQKQLGIKFLFRPGSTQFLPDPQISGAYPMWIEQVARRGGALPTCLEVDGHTSRSGPEPINERLSLMRAQAIERRIDALQPAVQKRTSAVGKGSSENISGLGTDDARDALDRRVGFKVTECRAG